MSGSDSKLAKTQPAKKPRASKEDANAKSTKSTIDSGSNSDDFNKKKVKSTNKKLVSSQEKNQKSKSMSKSCDKKDICPEDSCDDSNDVKDSKNKSNSFKKSDLSKDEINLNCTSSEDEDAKPKISNSKPKSKISKTSNNLSKIKPEITQSNGNDSSDDEGNEKAKIYKTTPTRGRPKKNQNESDSDEMNENESQKTPPKRGRPKKNLTEDSDDNECQPQPKRGRPKKVQQQQIDDDDDDDDEDAEAKKPAPKRGRPKKVQQQQIDDDDDEDAEAKKPAPKRGRPKKVQPQLIDADDDDDDANEDGEAQKPAPKKGRPKKNQQNDDDDADGQNKPAPKRGRPKKVQPQQIDEDEAQKPAPKRGRPRKNQAEDNSNSSNDNCGSSNNYNNDNNNNYSSNNYNYNSCSSNEPDENQPKPKRGRPRKSQPNDSNSNNDQSNNSPKNGDDDDDDDISNSGNSSQSSSSHPPSKIDSDLICDVKTIQGRKNCAQQTMGIITYGKNMGHYAIKLPDGTIEQVNIRKQISNAFKYSKTYECSYMPNIGVEEIYERLEGEVYFMARAKNDALDTVTLNNAEKLHNNLRLYKKFSLDRPMCQFSVVDGFAINMAKDLIEKDGLKPCILNFTTLTKNPDNFLRGIDSHEDAMMRQSSLYVTLMNSPMYEDNIKLKDGIFTDSMIYSSRIPVFRSPVKEELLPKKEVFEVSFVTSLLPDLSTPKSHKEGIRNIINPVEVNVVFQNRLRKMIFLALEKKHNALIIPLSSSALANDFKNDYLTTFQDLLFEEGLGNFFEKVVFANIGKKTKQLTLFEQIFSV